MKIAVLMLGWEFPPFISGGLGTASWNLANALSEHTSLTMVIPKSDEAYVPPHSEVVGLNKLELEKLKGFDAGLYYDLTSKVELALVKANLYPYEGAEIDVFAPLEDQATLPWGNPNEQQAASTEQQQSYSPPFSVQVSEFEQGGTSESYQEKYSHEHAEVHVNTDEQHVAIWEGMVEAFANTRLYKDDLARKVIAYSKLSTQIALEKEFDVIHAHDWMTFLAGLEIKRLTGKPLVLHIHSLEYDRRGAQYKGWIYQLEKYAMEQADLIIPVSEYSAEVIKTHYEITEEKLSTIYHGVEQEEQVKFEKKFPEPLVAFIGRITYQKGPSYFVDAAAKLLKENPSLRFVMAGQGDLMPEVMQKVAAHKIGHRFHFTGFLTSQQVRELLAMTDVFVMPSVSEPFGIIAIEAAQLGVPCVISNQSGVKEILKEALRFDYWDTDKLSRHIATLLEDPEMASTLAEKNLESLSLTWEDTAKQILSAYQELSF